MITKMNVRIAATVLSVALLAGCEKQRQTPAPTTNTDSATVEAQQAQNISPDAQQLAGKHICLILGYGYNDAAFVEKTRTLLAHKYGVESDDEDGLILLYVFPDDFDVGGKPRVSKLTSLLEDRTLAGLIVLGAPEGMGIPLAKLQDANEEQPYSVFSLFPQDDVLASEAVADFVLDYAHHSDAERDAEQGEFTATQDFDADALIVSSIQAMIGLRAPLKQDTSPQELLKFVQNLVGNKRTIVHYTDIESGIQSANHFIFQ